MPGRRFEEAELVAEFWEALRSFLRKSELVARKHGLTPQRQQLLVMIAGSRNGSSTITTLSERLSLAQNTVTEHVHRAELAGLIERRTSVDDARVAHLTLTREGRRRMRATMADLHDDREVLEAVLGALREREA
jgi:DNA-binding MarR family transcriptional regulator